MADPPALLLRVEYLQAELTGELAQRRQLERAIAHAEAELLEARLELARTRAGEQRALHQALHDGLTALPNRRYFRDRLDQQIGLHIGRGNNALAVMYLDLDAFKPINDLHGHDAGDEVLKIVAARLAHAVRAEDMMSRLGGDEFACLLANQPQRTQLREFAWKLREVVTSPMNVAGHCFRVRPSIGIALAPTDGRSADALLRSADTAMFHAKRHQTGVVFFDEVPGSSPGFAAGASRGTQPQGENLNAG
jgi:diguanylate cyclase (GGDEF)-like protein